MDGEGNKRVIRGGHNCRIDIYGLSDLYSDGELAMIYQYTWGNNPKRESMKGRACIVLATGKMNSVLIEFLDNCQKEVVSFRALRKVQMKKKSGTITYYLEIPVEVSYTWYPEERTTRHDPGYPSHIEADYIKYPTHSEMGEMLDKHAERIREACFEDLEE